MRWTLHLHQASVCPAVTRVEVDIVRPRTDTLILSYVAAGIIGDLRLSPVTKSARSDELWHHTCFEAFVGMKADARYYEFNLAPSTQWAVYQFDSYRSGMRDATGMPGPQIEVASRAGSFTLRAVLDLSRSELSGNAAWRLGLSAVIEDINGRRAYWALAHPPGKPDFHHSDCFAVELPSA
jgi:hypothetical protein